MGDYFYEKSKMYYEKYKANKLTKKVGSIVKDGDKYLTILRAGKRPMFAGGSVDEGETTREAIVREVLEETNATNTFTSNFCLSVIHKNKFLLFKPPSLCYLLL